MTTVKTVCPSCGDAEVADTDITLIRQPLDLLYGYPHCGAWQELPVLSERDEMLLSVLVSPENVVDVRDLDRELERL